MIACNIFDLCRLAFKQICVSPVNACRDGFYLIAHSWLGWLLIVYAAPTLQWILLFLKLSWIDESFGF